ncbi:OmpA family protein [Lichenicoccus sp.]|uniref:OmpA family protein n=1 Tax=Lichenicoccus sp. TaxID=2781899 RepID=UPI003D1107AC
MADPSPVPTLAQGLAPALAAVLAMLFTTTASAQTAGNQGALDSLGPVPPHHAVHQHHHYAVHQASRPQAAPPVAIPPIPAAPPPPPVIKAPIINVPLHPLPPPPPVPVVAHAVGDASAIAQHGTRITFGRDSADLNAATMQALRDFADRLKVDPGARALIDAYSHGTADDPSTPRRMALARGLAARAVLIEGGIPSTRIYVRAIGRPPKSPAPDDRVDLTVSGIKQQTAATQ